MRICRYLSIHNRCPIGLLVSLSDAIEPSDVPREFLSAEIHNQSPLFLLDYCALKRTGATCGSTRFVM